MSDQPRHKTIISGPGGKSMADEVMKELKNHQAGFVFLAETPDRAIIYSLAPRWDGSLLDLKTLHSGIGKLIAEMEKGV